jgi:hypothetical protein
VAHARAHDTLFPVNSWIGGNRGFYVAPVTAEGLLLLDVSHPDIAKSPLDSATIKANCDGMFAKMNSSSAIYGLLRTPVTTPDSWRLEEIPQKIRVEPFRDSGIIKVTCVDPSPNRALDTVDAVRSVCGSTEKYGHWIYPRATVHRALLDPTWFVTGGTIAILSILYLSQASTGSR